MSYITKFQAEFYYNIKTRNKVMKENNLQVKFYVERDTKSEWILKKETPFGNLPDKLSEYRKARDVWNEFLQKNKDQIPHWD